MNCVCGMMMGPGCWLMVAVHCFAVCRHSKCFIISHLNVLRNGCTIMHKTCGFSCYICLVWFIVWHIANIFKYKTLETTLNTMATENGEICILFTIHIDCFMSTFILISCRLGIIVTHTQYDFSPPLSLSLLAVWKWKRNQKERNEEKKNARHNHLRGRINHEVIYVKTLHNARNEILLFLLFPQIKAIETIWYRVWGINFANIIA